MKSSLILGINLLLILFFIVPKSSTNDLKDDDRNKEGYSKKVGVLFSDPNDEHGYNLQCGTIKDDFFMVEIGAIKFMDHDLKQDEQQNLWKHFRANESYCWFRSHRTKAITDIVLVFAEPNIQFSFEFESNRTSKSDIYQIKAISYRDQNGTTYEVDDIHYRYLFKIDHQGFQCEDLCLELEDKKIEMSEKKMKRKICFNNIELIGYSEDGDFDSIAMERCESSLPASTSTSDLVPIIVGSILLALMIICLVFYIFMRSRSEKNIDSK
ncbi:hypothetical protein SSS_09800 [Sarcoptes scabiei]|uniref:Uncharacterized protein n=1 Tax=Sarcoptes scabiei TaxID=52283 RepID=A0A132AM05_SARSC|nr:hypothetical protein SSS_09800 [Sarcoptes scabiei]KPM11879.1 hypothetical protein QR98_0104570 [Sarcoptes scabiei]UXI21664.1 major sperm protein [Sarcoptes scabiei]